MGIATKWAIRLQTSDFYGPSPSTPPPPNPYARLCPPPPLRSDFGSMTRLHALPLYQTLFQENGKVGNSRHGKCSPLNILRLPLSPTKGDREIERLSLLTVKQSFILHSEVHRGTKRPNI